MAKIYKSKEHKYVCVSYGEQAPSILTQYFILMTSKSLTYLKVRRKYFNGS